MNLSNLVGVRLDVIQSSDVKAIMGFQATDCHRRQSFGSYFMKTGLFICELYQCLRSVNHQAISQANKREQQTQQQWIQQVAGNPRWGKIYKTPRQRERRLLIQRE